MFDEKTVFFNQLGIHSLQVGTRGLITLIHEKEIIIARTENEVYEDDSRIDQQNEFE